MHTWDFVTVSLHIPLSARHSSSGARGAGSTQANNPMALAVIILTSNRTMALLFAVWASSSNLLTCRDCNDIALFHIQPLLPYCSTVWKLMLPPEHINTTLTPDSSFQTAISVVSSDNALATPPSPPPSLSLLLYTHLVCSLVPLCLLPYTSLVDPAMCLEWQYWVKENQKIIVIHTDTIII